VRLRTIPGWCITIGARAHPTLLATLTTVIPIKATTYTYRHSREGGNPAILYNTPFEFELAAQGILILLDSRLRGNDGLGKLWLFFVYSGKLKLYTINTDSYHMAINNPMGV
jgi:hypothetical protein